MNTLEKPCAKHETFRGTRIKTCSFLCDPCGLGTSFYQHFFPITTNQPTNLPTPCTYTCMHTLPFESWNLNYTLYFPLGYLYIWSNFCLLIFLWNPWCLRYTYHLVLSLMDQIMTVSISIICMWPWIVVILARWFIRNEFEIFEFSVLQGPEWTFTLMLCWREWWLPIWLGP